MKKNILLVAIAAALISGCSPILYSNRPAPVVNMNTPLSPGYQGAETTEITVNQQNPATQPTMPVRPNVSQQNVAPIQATQSDPYQTQDVYQPLQKSESGSSTSATQEKNDTAGWGVQPGTSVVNTADANTQNNKTGATAVRPQTQATESVGQDAPTAPAESKGSAQAQTEQQKPAQDVASNTAQPTNAAPDQGTVGNNQTKDVNKASTPIMILLQKASASLGKGDLEGAAAYLENAQRIEPQNAKILYDIANIRFHQGRYKDAETFAGRAVQVGGSNAMLKKSWAMIANARTKLGDSQGAILAAEKAASY